MILRTQYIHKQFAGEYEIYPGHKGEQLTEGSLTLSLKYKKRRRLVAGKLRINPVSIPGFPLSWEYIFQPNDPIKLDNILARLA